MTVRGRNGLGLGLVVLLTAAVVVGGEWLWRSQMSEVLCKAHGAFYGALVGASTSMLGFMLTTLALAAGLASLPMGERLRERALFADVHRAFFRPVAPLAVLCVLGVVGLFFGCNRWLLYVTTFFAACAMWPLGYAMVVLKTLLDAVSEPDDPAELTASLTATEDGEA